MDALQTSNTPNVTNTYCNCFFSNACRTRARAHYGEGLPARAAPTARARGIPPLELTRDSRLLTLMSPSNFHKMHTFLHVINTCHCLVMMTYTNIQRIAFLFHYFSPSYQTYPKAARLASLFPPSPLHTPPRIRGTTDPQASDHVSSAATPARKRDTRLAAAGFRPPFSGIYIYIIYIYNSIGRGRPSKKEDLPLGGHPCDSHSSA